GGEEPFLYSNGTMIGLGNLGSNTGWATARGINNSGVVVGSSWTAQDLLHGFAWTNGTMTDLGTLGGIFSQAWAINNSGQITGVAYLANGGEHAFITTVGGTMQDLGVLGELGGNPAYAWSWGCGINDAGQIVCTGTDNAGNQHAFLLTPLQ